MFDKGIEAFIAVANTKSISAAAKQLYITQPAVTHRLKELEAQLGLILLDRQRGVRSAELTQAGEMFYPIAEKWCSLWQETKDIQSTASKISVRIGCVDSISTFLLPDFYRNLSGIAPQVHLRIHTMRSTQLYDKIVNRELDVAFALQKRHLKHINVTTFFKENMVVVRNSDQKERRDTIDLKALDPQKELYINWSPSYQNWHERLWQGMRHSKIELDSVSLALKLIQGSRYWAILPQSAVSGIRDKSAYRIQHTVQNVPERVTYIVTHQYPRIAGKPGIEAVLSLAENITPFY